MMMRARDMDTVIGAVIKLPPVYYNPPTGPGVKLVKPHNKKFSKA